MEMMPVLKIKCLKVTCEATADLDVSGMRKDNGQWQAVNARRPAGWIAGPGADGDSSIGLCPGHAAEWQDSINDFLHKEVPAAPEKPRQYSIKEAQNALPVSNLLMQTVDSRQHAENAAPRAGSMSPIPSRAVVHRPNLIQPKVSQASGGYGASMPASTPSTPIMHSFRSAGAGTSPPAVLEPATPNMAVHTKTSPIAHTLNCTPDQHGKTAPAFHSTTPDNLMPVSANALFVDNEVTVAPPAPLDAATLSALRASAQ